MDTVFREIIASILYIDDREGMKFCENQTFYILSTIRGAFHLKITRGTEVVIFK